MREVHPESSQFMTQELAEQRLAEDPGVRRAIEEGQQLEACHLAGQVLGVQPLGDAQNPWPRTPRGNQVVSVRYNDRRDATSPYYAVSPKFAAEEAKAYAEAQTGQTKESATKLMQTLGHGPADEVARRSRAEGSSSMGEIDAATRSFQAAEAARRVGWANVFTVGSTEAGYFTVCQPDGSVVAGHASDVRPVIGLLKETGYRRMPVDDPRAENIFQLAADLSGEPIERVRPQQPQQQPAPEA